MFGVHKKLRYWAEAGLLTPEQQAAITRFEKNRQQGRFGRGIAGLALFAIVIGVLSLIAANWGAIPASLKIIVHFALNIGLAYAVWRAALRGSEMLREGALLALGGLTLTLIALIGQVFQLGGSMAGALLVWQMAMVPAFLLYGQTRLTAVPGLLAFTGSVAVIVFEAAEKLSDFWAMFGGLAVLIMLPLLYIGLGFDARLRALRPQWCDTALRFGFVVLVLAASLASLLWYQDRSVEFHNVFVRAGIAPAAALWLLTLPVLGAVLGLLGHWAFFRRRVADPQFYAHSWCLILISVVMIGLPIILPNGHSDMLAMGSFLGYWGFLGWYAHATGATRLLSLAIAVMAVRIWVIYLEAFGGLAMTGFGLIFGGAFMLAMIYGARRLNRRLGNAVRTQQAEKI